jgi:hypothetical protein
MASPESNIPATDQISPDLDKVRETMRERDASIDPAPQDAPNEDDAPPDDDEAPERRVEDDPDRGEDEPDEDE